MDALRVAKAEYIYKLRELDEDFVTLHLKVRKRNWPSKLVRGDCVEYNTNVLEEGLKAISGNIEIATGFNSDDVTEDMALAKEVMDVGQKSNGIRDPLSDDVEIASGSKSDDVTEEMALAKEVMDDGQKSNGIRYTLSDDVEIASGSKSDKRLDQEMKDRSNNDDVNLENVMAEVNGNMVHNIRKRRANITSDIGLCGDSYDSMCRLAKTVGVEINGIRSHEHWLKSIISEKAKKKPRK